MSEQLDFNQQINSRITTLVGHLMLKNEELTLNFEIVNKKYLEALSELTTLKANSNLEI